MSHNTFPQNNKVQFPYTYYGIWFPPKKPYLPTKTPQNTQNKSVSIYGICIFSSFLACSVLKVPFFLPNFKFRKYIRILPSKPFLRLRRRSFFSLLPVRKQHFYLILSEQQIIKPVFWKFFHLKNPVSIYGFSFLFFLFILKKNIIKRSKTL